jgi:hypothetical protein
MNRKINTDILILKNISGYMKPITTCLPDYMTADSSCLKMHPNMRQLILPRQDLKTSPQKVATLSQLKLRPAAVPV